MSGRHWIVCAVWDREAVADDEWHAFDTEAAARAAYDNVIENGATSVSLCAVIQSTDYEPHPAFVTLDIGSIFDTVNVEADTTIVAHDIANAAAQFLRSVDAATAARTLARMSTDGGMQFEQHGVVLWNRRGTIVAWLGNDRDYNMAALGEVKL